MYECEGEMICDLAETYHILNYQELSPTMVATLVLGLKDNSRVKMKLGESKLTLDQTLLAMMVDSLNFLCWTKTKAGSKNRNRPKSILKELIKKDEEKLMAFDTPEEYEAYMQELRKA